MRCKVLRNKVASFRVYYSFEGKNSLKMCDIHKESFIQYFQFWLCHSCNYNEEMKGFRLASSNRDENSLLWFMIREKRTEFKNGWCSVNKLKHVNNNELESITLQHVFMSIVVYVECIKSCINSPKFNA